MGVDRILIVWALLVFRVEPQGCIRKTTRAKEKLIADLDKSQSNYYKKGCSISKTTRFSMYTQYSYFH